MELDCNSSDEQVCGGKSRVFCVLCNREMGETKLLNGTCTELEEQVMPTGVSEVFNWGG